MVKSGRNIEFYDSMIGLGGRTPGFYCWPGKWRVVTAGASRVLFSAVFQPPANGTGMWAQPAT